MQASAFARSDTTLQLAWVIGGFVGIALPLDPPWLGLSVAFAVLSAWSLYVLTSAPRARLRAAGRERRRGISGRSETRPDGDRVARRR